MLFESALLESGGHLHTHQRWTALFSITAQAAMVAGVVMASMIFTDTLPRQLVTDYVLPVPPAGRAAETPKEAPRQGSAAAAPKPGLIQQPAAIPLHTLHVVDPVPVPFAGNDDNAVLGSPGPAGASNTVVDDVARRAAALPPKRPEARVIRLSRPEPGALIYRVDPKYPQLAVVTRTSGTVVLRATISAEGRIVNLQAESGPALLISAAIEAVQQWRYRPYVLNGEAVSVETEIRVNFVLSH